MRLHELTVARFGPFAGTERVDFDELSDAGLFLLCGATGAGKTTVLDAVCFALYGSVPGDRDKAKRLRSDHADAGDGPRVELDVTLRGRRLRITRSPEWQRPKRRGRGTVREPAKVLLEELVDGGWQQRTNRIDEAADLLGQLIGMTAVQFCQVAMLPQGRFESFLRSNARDRHDLLERLFDAGRFRRVELWLAERKKELARRCDSQQSRVAGVLARIQEVADTSARDRAESPVSGPDPIPGPVLPESEEPDALLEWSAELRDLFAERAAEAERLRQQTDELVKVSRAALDEARMVAAAQARRHDARQQLERLDALADDTARLRDRVDAARRAEAVTPVASLWEEALGAAERAAAQAPAAWSAARELTAPWLPSGQALPDRDRVLSALDDARQTVARLTALLPRQQELQRVDDELRLTERSLQAQQQQHCRTVEQFRVSQARIDDVAAAREEVERAAGRLELLQARHEQAHRRQVQATRAESIAGRLAELSADVTAAERAALAAKERWLDARQARLDGIAAELAGALRAGEACPVCGSPDHPRPATTVPIAANGSTMDDPAADRTGAAAAQAEEAAEAAFQLAEATRIDLVRDTDVARSELSAARSAADGRDVDSAGTELADVAREIDEARAAARELDRLERRLAEAQTMQQRAADARETEQAELQRLQERLDQLTDRSAGLRRSLADATGGSTFPLLRQIENCESAVAALQDLLERIDELDRATRRADELARRVAATARTQGFADEQEAAAAALPSSELSTLEGVLGERDRERQRAAAILDEPGVQAVADLAAPDLTALQQAADADAGVRDHAVSVAVTLDRQAQRLATLHDDLATTLADGRPLLAEYRRVADLATLCSGSPSADNPDRVSLSAYVLAARLAQVVEAANERLGRMSSGRYQLELSQARGVGERLGGLGLRVHDGWTGETRDPATLSGGETFLAALSLALGLSDVVAFEAGGVELGTLFVDEGFGALDQETLDEVMDVLDDLRDSGRVVGLVSHVPELRSRVVTRLQVVKTRTGSTLVRQ